MRFFLFIILLLQSLSSHATERVWNCADTIKWERPDTTKSFRQYLRKAKRMMKKMNDIDTNYIEPQRYNFTVMLQNTDNFEVYALNSKNGQSITFAPDPSIRIGPYVGWRWVFLGYTLDIKHPFATGSSNQKKELDLSIYSSKIGVELYYRNTGNDYKIRRMNLGQGIDTSPMRGVDFNQLKSTVKGFNVYYIFNHRRFSYPAAFSQSTMQRKSAGSPLIGIGYTRHTLEINWPELYDEVAKRVDLSKFEGGIDSTLMVEKIRYTDISVNGGYAYNWVFAHNWLAAGSLTIGLAYKRNSGKIIEENFNLRNFISNNLNLDATARIGLVWNNMKWYAGMSAIMHAYNYRRDQFSSTNLFGNINFYVGMNFGKRNKSKKNKNKKQ